jgi:hypothetical protein
VICEDLLECLATTDRLHGDSGHELRALGPAFAQLLRRRLFLGRESPAYGALPRLRVIDRACLKKMTA